MVKEPKELHIKWAEGIMKAYDWLKENDWIDEDLRINFMEDEGSFYYIKQKLINVDLKEVEETEPIIDECTGLDVFLHEVGHHIHMTHLDGEDLEILYSVHNRCVDYLAQFNLPTEQELPLYWQTPIEAEAEIGRKYLREVLKKNRVIPSETIPGQLTFL